MDPVVQCFLTEFMDNYQSGQNPTPADWRRYYDFIVVSKTVDRGQRPTVSELVELFRTKDMPFPGTVAMIYAHGLYVLARANREKIFKGGFNY